MNAKLLVVQGRPQGKSLFFPPGEYLFGRGAECHIRPNSDWVSRQHCLLRVTHERRIFITDLGSRNGTLVNGVRILAETALKHGDHLQVGPLVFEVCLEEGSGLRKSPSTGLQNETQTLSTETTHLPAADEPAEPSIPDDPGPADKPAASALTDTQSGVALPQMSDF